ncbi:hypothetical protein BKA83DRAFT_4465872 [Pisolithus microcarpus]|nr:hypothetical protein BKA83DRAFT_4465872 [Pisolithus microcarpus]
MSDEYYGHEHTSPLSTRFITHLFACPELPPSSSGSMENFSKKHCEMLAVYPPRRMKLHPSVTFTTLILPQRLKARFPTARGSSSHRLFISAFMLASKVICNDTCSNKSWSVVARGMFQLQEINQMEREIHGPFDTR